MQQIDFSKIPTIAWIIFLFIALLLILVVIAILVGIFYLLNKKNIKTKIFELNQPIKPEIKEKYIAEGKDLIDNQSQVAKLMLKTGRIKVYEEGLKLFNIKNSKDKIILEMITYRINDRLNYELKNDFTRNHIVNKTNYELEQYADAKSKGYYRLITEKLYMFNEKLPEYNLPKIMDNIPFEEVKKIFTDIYFSARGIAGVNGGNQNEQHN